MNATSMDLFDASAFAEAPAPRALPFSALFPYMALAVTVAVLASGAPGRLAASRRDRRALADASSHALTPTTVSYPVLDAPLGR